MFPIALTKSGCETRRARLWAALPERCDALVLADPQSLIYYANYAPSPFVFRTSDASAFLILRPGRATLVADKMLGPYLDQAHVDEAVAPVWYDARHTAPHRRAQAVATAREVLRNGDHNAIGVETASVPFGIFEGLSAGSSRYSLETTIRPLRRAKDPDEVELLRLSARAGVAGLTAALRDVRPGMSELDVYLLVQNEASRAAGSQVMVYGDFASGPRLETERGGPPTSRVVERGDLFMVDYSVVVHGYRCDFTNTFAVGTPPTEGQRRLFDVCIEALRAGEQVLKPGVAARAVDAAVRAVLDAHGLGHASPSHTGHGLGLSHPEPPYLVGLSVETIEPGDVVALEPGVYVPGVGGMRFERNYLVTADGFECLTDHELTLDQPG